LIDLLRCTGDERNAATPVPLSKTIACSKLAMQVTVVDPSHVRQNRRAVVPVHRQNGAEIGVCNDADGPDAMEQTRRRDPSVLSIIDLSAQKGIRRHSIHQEDSGQSSQALNEVRLQGARR
jgi:hypothetical protein